MNTQHHETDSTQGLWRTRGYPTWFTADTATAVGVALRTLAITLLGYHISGSTVTAGWIGLDGRPAGVQRIRGHVR